MAMLLFSRELPKGDYAKKDRALGLRLPVRSGRIEARIGLRMMPTFPRSPPIIPYGEFSPVRLEGLAFQAVPSRVIGGLSLLPAFAVRHPVCIRPSCISWSLRWSALRRA